MKNETTFTCVILGGGGHASVLIDSMLAGGYAAPCAVLDSNPACWGKDLLGVPILGGDDLLPELAGQGTSHFVVGLGSTGDNHPRQRLFELGLAHNLAPLTIVHPAAICSRWATLGSGAQVLPASVVNAGARLGANVIVNSGAVVEHDCVLGDHVHVATGATLASTVRVGTGAHIGAGASIRQCVNVGEWAIVGAGGVVVKDVPSHTIVVGVPARELRKH
jgi:sugar O-acyltransferase (sialic acid O-acetyltransferase NeuD family)